MFITFHWSLLCCLTDNAPWLVNFSKHPATSWDGLCLSQPINISKRQMIKRQEASLLDLRNYLFSRQCTLLFLVARPWEVGERALPFMHNCIKELGILEVNSMSHKLQVYPDGYYFYVKIYGMQVL